MSRTSPSHSSVTPLAPSSRRGVASNVALVAVLALASLGISHWMPAGPISMWSHPKARHAVAGTPDPALSDKDILLLEDGSFLEGKIVSEDRSKVVIEILASGLPLRKTIPRDEITKIVRANKKDAPAPGKPETPSERADHPDASTPRGETEPHHDEQHPPPQVSGKVPPEVAARVAELAVGYRITRQEPNRPEIKIVAERRPGKPFVTRGDSKHAPDVNLRELEAIRVRLDFRGEIEAQMWLGGSEPIPLAVFSSDATSSGVLAATASRSAQLRIGKAHGALTTVIDVRNGQYDEGQAKEAFQTVIARALETVHVHISFDGVNLVTARIRHKDGVAALHALSVEPLETSAHVAEEDRMRLPHVLQGIARFHRERGSPPSAAIRFQQPTAWNATVIEKRSTDVVVFRGCWHCSRRPGFVPPLSMQCASCDGCRHVAACNGDPTRCKSCDLNARGPHRAGCSGGVDCSCPGKISREHCVTYDEAGLWKKRFDSVLDNPSFEGVGGVAEVRVEIPCLAHRIQNMTRPGYARTWTLVARIEAGGLPPDARDVVSVDGLDPDVCAMRASPIEKGSIALEAVSAFEDTVEVRDSTANDSSRTLASVQFKDGKSRSASEALHGARLVLRTATGGLIQYRIDSSRGELSPEDVDFESWRVASGWSPAPTTNQPR